MISNDGDILEDRLVYATGSYSGTANQFCTDSWVMQLVAFRLAPGVTAGFIQNNGDNQPVTFTEAQIAGDLNVLVLGWDSHTAQLSSITDTEGNTYAQAAGPVTISGDWTQVVYYAKTSRRRPPIRTS
jgi:hypothetical protein